MATGKRMRREPQRARFVDRDRLIRYQPERRNRIPGGIAPEDFLQITRILRTILHDIDNELKNAQHKPKELHIRLNESDKPFAFPVFAGWVEADDVRKKRQDWNHPDPGLHRFGDDVYSEIYGEAFRYAGGENAKNHFRSRNWEKGELLEKRAGEKATDPKAGNRFQTCLAMVARVDGQLRAVGTLVVGFRRKPPHALLRKAQDILRKWARESNTRQRSSLRNFLRKYELGGPRLEKSDWVRQI